MKILHISDCHFGLQYATIKNLDAKNKVIDSRLEALINSVNIANNEKCEAIVIAGDLFENLGVTQKIIKQVCAVLNKFTNGTVWVLPGNHDYYAQDNHAMWDYFEDVSGDNIFLFTKNAVEEREISGKTVRFYPCICHDIHSAENALGWIEQESIDRTVINIGVAHGSLQGLSFDKEGIYYSMSAEELDQVPVDVWLIGHAHIAEPNKPYDEVFNKVKIYNAGTHQQTNIHNNSEGSVFIIEINHNKEITAKRIKTGCLKFMEKAVVVSPSDSLNDKINKSLNYIDKDNTVLRLQILGTANSDDYDNRGQIESLVSSSVLYLDKLMWNVTKEITVEMIDEETVIGSIENTLLKKYVDDPEVLSVAFNLVMACKEKKL